MRSTMMDAVVFEGEGRSEFVKKPVPEIKKGSDVLIRIEIVSICGSDLHALSVPPAFPAKPGVILGHELVGIVEEIGTDVASVAVGDRVILDPNVPCGSCYYCKCGKPNMCENIQALGFDIDGAFAQYVICPESLMMKISKEIPLERAMFAEPMNCVYGAIKKIRLLAGETVLVLGAGPIGLLFAQLLKANGAGKIFVSEVSPFRQEFARKVGVTEVFDPTKQNLQEEIYKATDGRGVNVTVDAAGSLIVDAINCTGRGGRIVIFGVNFSKQQTISQSQLVMKELSVFGNYIGDFTIPDVATVLENELIKPEILITHKLPLRKIQDGLDDMRQGKAMKVALYPWKE